MPEGQTKVSPDSGKPREPADDGLHFGFVELLFSLAVAEIAVRFATVIDEAKVLWLNWNCWAGYAHLLLALFVITTSWIGWGKSFSSHRDSKLNSVFTLDFAELLIDVGLVITYFVLVHRAETVVNASGNISTSPSIGPEAICIPTIFTLYLLWDIVSKFPWRKEKGGKQLGWKKLLSSGSVSLLLVCLASGISSFAWYACGLSRGATVQQVVVFDLSMIGLIILFRELKAYLHPPKECAGQSSEKDANGTTAKRPHVYGIVISICLTMSFLALKWI